MEVNKDAAEQCRDMGATALRARQYPRAVKLLKKSLNLYPLPGVKALLTQAEKKLTESSSHSTSNSTTSNGNYPSSTTSSSPLPSNANSSSSSNNNNIRSHTPEQAKIVEEILQSSKQGNSSTKPHYRVLGIPEDANDAQIKKAYRKLAVKVHPDKNSAPKSDEAFKAVGLAYATLSDSQKRQIYDRYGEEDPDNTGGAGMRRHGGFGRRGEEVSPEDIFNMFFNGMGPAGPGMRGGPGFRMYTAGPGGFNFNMGRPRQRQGQQQQQQRQQPNGVQTLFQLLPLVLLMLLSFFSFESSDTSYSKGVSTMNQYFSLTQQYPYVNQQHTRLVSVKDIPFYVTDKFMRTYGRDRYSLGQVERMVETTYEKYLRQECKEQKKYREKLERNVALKHQKIANNDDAMRQEERDAAREKDLRKAKNFQLTRCDELQSLFGDRNKNRR